MDSPLGSAVASVPGSVLPCGVVLYGSGATRPGTTALPCRAPGLDARISAVPLHAAGLGQILQPGLAGLDPVSVQLARLSRYQQAAAAAAAAACLITGTSPAGQQQSSSAHLLSYLYARQQQHRLHQEHCNSGIISAAVQNIPCLRKSIGQFYFADSFVIS